MQLYVVFSIVIAALAIFFALQNTVVISVRFLIWDFEGSLAFILIVTFALGFLTHLCVSLPMIIKTRRNLRKQMNKLQEVLSDSDVEKYNEGD